MVDPQKILIIRRRYLGDVVLLGSLFRNLRLHWPDARIVAAVEPAYEGILGLNPDVNAVITLPASTWEWPRFVRKVRTERFTHVLDIDNTERTALITRLSGAPFRLAMHHGKHALKLPSLYTHLVHDPEAEHETHTITDYYLKALAPAGVPVVSHDIQLFPRQADVDEWKRFVGARGKTLLVHPGSRSPSRVWPTERFAAVCDRIQDEMDVQVVLAGGPADAALVKEIRAHMKTHVISPRAALTQRHFAALSKASSVLLCHDSGPMHVAAAVGIPVVALYGSQNPKLFSPAGAGHALVIPAMPCAACVAPATCVPGDSYRNFCVRQNSVEDVYKAVRGVLERIR